MQMDVWENKFLSARPFYFTSYDGCVSTVEALTASTKNIYPGLKPVFNKEKKVVGYKGILDPKILIEKFKKSEETVLLMKVK
jgi:predicted rRNA methylase YqxC with S4 and FtsJ domains